MQQYLLILFILSAGLSIVSTMTILDFQLIYASILSNTTVDNSNATGHSNFTINNSSQSNASAESAAPNIGYQYQDNFY